MAVIKFGSPVRPRLVTLAVFITLTVLYLGYQRPVSIQHGESAAPDDARWPPQAGVKVVEPDPYEVPIADRPTQDAVEGPTAVSSTGTGTGTNSPTPTPTKACLDFMLLQQQKPGPASDGKRHFPYVRPPVECRKFNLPSMEALIARMEKAIADPDLFRLFENTYPNTLDTMVKWKGYANVTDEDTREEIETDEELTYITTGDIDAAWLRGWFTAFLSSCTVSLCWRWVGLRGTGEKGAWTPSLFLSTSLPDCLLAASETTPKKYLR